MTRTVLVTGGARGIGKGIAKAFLQADHNVMIADLADQGEWNYKLASSETMRETVQELGGFGEINAVAVDVTDAESCKAAVAATVDCYGGLDVLANNAGIITSGPIDELTEAEWDSTYNVNVKGIFHMVRAALPVLKTSGDAAIVNTSSISGLRGGKNHSSYCGSKFAVIGISQSLAQEFAPHGIRVNAICPGIIGTAMWHDHLMRDKSEEEFNARMQETIPLGRPQTVEDIGEGVVYLATAKNVTGIAHIVAGGILMS